ncbi:MAG TPA: glycosyl hydrolase [Dermatophilaceae bacterium]|nr:glycosyl hydrolase [Dermatophilaceae bacterium]
MAMLPHLATSAMPRPRHWAVTAWLVLAVTMAPMVSVRPPSTTAPLASRVRLGAYVHLDGQPYRDPVSTADLTTLEDRVGRLDIVHYFFTWGRQFHEAVSPNLDGRDLMLSMQPDGDLVRQIADGAQDGYLDRFAAQARAFGRPVYLRFGHEMNGEWMAYSAGRPGGPSAAAFVAAWRHLVARFRAAGADNVRFVWSPNESDFPDRSGNRMEDYWPGTDVVDVAGFDAYNWSTRSPRRGDGRDRSFEQIVAGPYRRLGRLTLKPVWLCEFGTVEPGKARWLRDMFGSRRFPRLQALIYFSENDQRDVQRDWRLDTSAAAVAAWRDGRAARPR